MAAPETPHAGAAQEQAAPAQGTAEQSTAAPQQAKPADGGIGGAEVAEMVAEMEDRWRRAVADLDNFRKRTARDMARQQADERARVTGEWLPVIDTLELALEHAGTSPGAIVQGVRGVRDQALATLERLGYPRRDDVGQAFDPARHEAVSTVVDESAAPGTILQVVRPGYGTDDRMLRPAAVVVATRQE
jgi:molecular chaperone GrpE